MNGGLTQRTQRNGFGYQTTRNTSCKILYAINFTYSKTKKIDHQKEAKFTET